MALDKEKLHVLSRLARKPIIVPANVKIDVEGCTITGKGPHGTLSRTLHPYVSVKLEEGKITVHPDLETLRRPAESKKYRAMTGTYFSLIRSQGVGFLVATMRDLFPAANSVSRAVLVAIPERCWSKLRASLSPVRIALTLPEIPANTMPRSIFWPSCASARISMLGSSI